MNILPQQIAEMLDLYSEPSFSDLENLAFISQCDDEFVYLLGVCFCKSDLDQIKAFVHSRIWFTYRKEFPAIGGTGPTSDVGWGCMLRCGQMLLAQVLSVIHLGRNWQWQLNCKDPVYRRLLSMFEDQRSSLFSIHQIAQMGVSEGKPLGEWFGPNTIAQVLKKLVVYDEWSNLAVHVAMDNILISEDVRIMAGMTEKVFNVSVNFDGRGVGGTHSSYLSPTLQETSLSKTDIKWRRPLLIIVPLRLGLTVINECYSTAIKEFFKLPQCAGIVGGRPNHAVYFFGQVGNKLLYLDPHVSHQRVDISYGEERQRRMKANSDLDVHLLPTSVFSLTPSITQSSLNVEIPEVSTYSAPILFDTHKTERLAHVDKLSDKTEARDTTNEKKDVPSKSNSSSNSIIDVFSSPRGTTPEANTSVSSNPDNETESGDGTNSMDSWINNSNIPHNNKCHLYLSAERRRKPQKIASTSSYSMPSSVISSYTETNSDSLQKYEIDNNCALSLTTHSVNDDTETIDLPDTASSETKLTPSLRVSASSSSSTEMLPSLVTMLAQSTAIVKSGSTTQNGGISRQLPTNFEFVAPESAELSNTTTEDERRDEASGESEKLNDDDSGKRKVIRQKRKTKRKISNGTFTDIKNLNNSDNDFEDVKIRPNNKFTLKKVNNDDLTNVNYTADDCEKLAKETVAETCGGNSVVVENAEEKPDKNKLFVLETKLQQESEQGSVNQNDEKKEDDFDDSTYHCSFILNMDFKTLDPSLALAFICLCPEDYNDLKDRLSNSVLPASSPPLFEILERRPPGWSEFVPYSMHDESLKMKEYDDFGDPQFDSDDQFELLE